MSTSADTLSPILSPGPGPDHTIPVAPTPADDPLTPAVYGMDPDQPTHDGGINPAPDHM